MQIYSNRDHSVEHFSHTYVIGYKYSSRTFRQLNLDNNTSHPNTFGIIIMYIPTTSLLKNDVIGLRSYKGRGWSH